MHITDASNWITVYLRLDASIITCSTKFTFWLFEHIVFSLKRLIILNLLHYQKGVWTFGSVIGSRGVGGGKEVCRS